MLSNISNKDKRKFDIALINSCVVYWYMKNIDGTYKLYMENMINIAEILKDCPKGMELDCTMYNGVVTLEQVQPLHTYSIKIRVKCGDESFTNVLTEYGQTSPSPCNKCVIFPKGKTTWEGFQRPFKDGDVCTGKVSGSRNLVIFIYKERINTTIIKSHFTLVGACKNCYIYLKDEEIRFATEEEKQRLFHVIKENGYRWDSETKTLYKSEFKDGDVCTSNANGNFVIFLYKKRINPKLVKSHFALYGHVEFFKNCCIPLKDEELKFATEEEKQELLKAIQDNGYRWDFETKTLRVVGKLGKLKFKVGDVVQDKEGNKVKITEIVHECGCYLYKTEITNEIGKIYFDEDNDWELVPNKFDITTLKPFDKVLVRTETLRPIWSIDFYGGYHPNSGFSTSFAVTNGNYFQQCIPYKGNEHLLGTTNDCDEFYKNWE